MARHRQRPSRTPWCGPTRAIRSSMPSARGCAELTRPSLMAVAAYRPQIMAILTGGLQQVRVLFPDNTVQIATLQHLDHRPYGLPDIVQRLQDREYGAPVRSQRAVGARGVAQYRAGRAGRRGDSRTPTCSPTRALVEAQRVNVTFLRETLGTTKKRLDAGDVTPTDVAQAEARLSRGQADLNAAEVNYAISQAIYAQVTGAPPGRLAAADPIDRLLPRTREEAHGDQPASEHPAILAAPCTTPTWPSSAPRSPKAAYGRTSRCRAASSAMAERPDAQRDRPTISPRSWDRPMCRSTTAGSRPRRLARPRNSRCRPVSCWSSFATRPRPR